MNGRPNDIAVVGMACRFPHARDLSSLWKLLESGEVAFEPIPASRWNHETFFDGADARAVDKTYVKKGAFIDGVEEFAALHYGLAPRRVQVADPQQRWLVEITRQALEDAGLGNKAFDRANTGVFVGASVSEYKDILTSRLRAQQMADGTFGGAPDANTAAAIRGAVAEVVPTRAFSIAGSLLNMIAATVSQVFDLGGPSFSLDAACSSALVAIHEAVVHLRANQCNIALAGGVYFNLTPDNLVGFSRIGAISPSGACRPFDSRADGFVMGEGVGMVVLKRLEDAQAAGDRIYAVIRGSGCNNDGRGEGPMTPRPEGQKEAMVRAHRDAEMPVDTIDFVETHGTATTVGDVVEVGALKSFFVERAGKPLAQPYCYLSSIKANIGHTMSAAGVAGFIKTVLSLYHRTIPPQPGIEELNPRLDLPNSPFKITQRPIEWPESPLHPRRAAVSSFGFGGTNAHVLLEEGPRPQPTTDAAQLVVVSAPTAPLLAAHLDALAGEVETHGYALADVARTLASRPVAPVRVAFVASDTTELTTHLRAAATALKSNATPPVGVWAGKTGADKSPRIVFLVPGQGLQRVGLFLSLFERFPKFRARLTELDRASRDATGISILDALYPQAPYDISAAQRQLTQTEVCQPAMAALGVALGEFLLEANIAPDAILGHSLGEFAGAALAGVYDGADAVRLVAKRGQLMQGSSGTDPGAMLAAMASRAQVEAVAREIRGVVVANDNHPTQVVLSGTTDGIARAKAALELAGVKATLLDVSHAFHSPLMQAVDTSMAPLLKALPLQAPTRTLVSCITGAPLKTGADAASVWVRHASSPVAFTDATRACAAPATTYVQLGAGNTLLSFARGTAVADATFVSLAPSDAADSSVQFLEALAQLFVLGAPLNAASLFEGAEASLVPLPPSPLETEKYWAIERGARVVAAAPATSPKTPKPQGTAAMDNIVSLFQQQMALLQAQADLMRAQATALSNLSGGAPVPAGAMPALPTPAAAPAATDAGMKPPSFANLVAEKSPQTAPDGALDLKAATAKVEATVLAEVSRISAFPQATLKLEQSLTDELGFDSLMLVELDQSLSKAWPGVGGLPREMLSRTTTVKDVVAFFAGKLAGGATNATPAAQASTVPATPFELVRTATSLPTTLQRPTLANGPLLVVDDAAGTGKVVVESLRAKGVAAELGTPHTTGAFSGVIYLGHTSPSSSLEQPTLDAIALAQRFATPPEVFVVAVPSNRRMPGASGALGVARSLSLEWPGTRVKAIEFDGPTTPPSVAEFITAETLAADRTVSVLWNGAERAVTTFRPATRSNGPGLTRGDAVVVTGGAKGVGLVLAKSLARSLGASLEVWGRSPASPEIEAVLRELTSLGAATARYRQVDVRNRDAVKQALVAARAQLGKLDAVVHAAGILNDGLVDSKKPNAVRGVLETKAVAAQAILETVGTWGLKAVAFVGSWSGRFGNAGQTDYAAANALLGELASQVETTTRVVAIDFPPWEDSAMARKIPSFKKQELQASGVPFLSDAEGAQSFLSALESGRGELLISRTAPEAVVALRLSETLAVETHPFLAHHEMAGQRVLPLASAMDFLAAAAARATRASTFKLSNFALKRPVIVNEPTAISVEVSGTSSAAQVSLQLGTTPAYTATFEKLDAAQSRPSVPATPATELPLPLAEFYAQHVFHGPMLQGIDRIESLTAEGVSGWVKPSAPSTWVKSPTASTWTIDPLVIDSSFQLAGYWAWVNHQRAGFPIGFDAYEQFEPFGTEPVRCVVRLEAGEGDLFKGTLTWVSAAGKTLAVMRGARAEFKRRDPQFRVAATARPAAIDESTYNFALFPEYVELQERIGMAEGFGLKNPYFSVHERICNDTTQVNGKEMINFSSYNYVGNSGDPKVSGAAKAAIDKYGTSVSASRVASGEKPLTRELEAGLARFFGTESCLVFVSGHATNVTVIGHIVGAGDLILHDALAHDSIIQGAKLSGAKRRPFPHNDWATLEKTLASLRPHYRRVLIAIEGTYSMDGDIPDLPRFIELKKKYGALLLVDEAHSAGVVGRSGRGIGEYYDVNRADVDMWMGTLSKSFASCGGYVCGTKALTEWLKYTAPGFVYSVGISPPNAASALAALENLEQHPERVQKLQTQAKKFVALLKARGVNTGMTKDSAVVPAIIGNSFMCLQLSDRLKDRGINVQPILYPAVEEESARLRFFLSCTHTDEQLTTTANILAEELTQLRREHEADAVA